IGGIGEEPETVRFEVFHRCLRERSLKLHRQDVALRPLETRVPSWDVTARPSGASAMAQVLEQGQCTAVICETDGFAFGAVDALRERGLVPGREVSVVGYDNLEYWGWLPFEEPMLTTVHNPLDKIGEMAAL